MLFTYPIFVAILGALFFNTPLSKKIIISLLFTYLGLWIMLNKEIKINTGDVIDGVLLVTLSALSYAIYVLLSKKVIDSIGSVWFTAIAMSVSSVIVLVYYALFFSFEQLSISYYAWVWVFLLALFSTVIPGFMISEALL